VHPILQEARRLMEQLEAEPPHVLQVARLSLALFDGLEELHRLQPSSRLLLETAALLHDIGWSRSPSGRKHHKHSASIIREHRWQSLPPKQVEILALIARYHRKSLPHDGHEDFAGLNVGQQEVVQGCAALLRIADALDRSHTQPVEKLKVGRRQERWCVSVFAASDCLPERSAFEKKKDLFERFFGCVLTMRITLPAGLEP
jgi:exopolyphosphatase/guanosine-5'-triphosphate,3'-diphosphate pyrophosphatase